MEKELFINDDINSGYKRSVILNHGVIYINEEELFSRPEYACFDTESGKLDFAINQGWRWDIPKGQWYRIKGY